MTQNTNPTLPSLTAFVQGLYFFITGLWPLVDLNSFEKVTGPKRDSWLVKTVGSLITVIGAVLTLAGYRRKVSPETSLLAMGSSAALTGIDMMYVAKKRISPVYLLDALAELSVLFLWLFALRRGFAKENDSG